MGRKSPEAKSEKSENTTNEKSEKSQKSTSMKYTKKRPKSNKIQDDGKEFGLIFFRYNLRKSFRDCRREKRALSRW